jgi:flavin reductase (DIM6/NTAB) family NADH-FMN oxidoreductase RutF
MGSSMMPDSTAADARPDSRAFRRTIGLFATGVTVVAVQTPDGVLGMTANAVTSVSLDPLLVLVCVSRQVRLASQLPEGREFSINILRDDQEVLSRYFSGGWRDLPTPEFRFLPWGEAPRLVGALASVRCAVERRLDGGDHWIVMGRVLGLFEDAAEANPLLFFAGRYRRPAPLVAPAAPPERWGPDGTSIYHEEWSATPGAAPPEAGEPPE